MKKALLICLALIQAIVVLAQDGSLKGTVRDSQTKETLIGATVLIVGTYKGMACDIDGNYIIKDIKPGDYSIKVSF